MSSRDVAIVGVGEARVGKDADCSSWELHVEAVQAALADAGAELRDVDGLITCPSTIDDHARHHVLVAEHLGMHTKRYTDSSRVGGASGASAVRDAVNVVRSGVAEMVVISCADTQRRRVGRADAPIIKMAHYHSRDYEIPYGPLIISLYALVAQRWMHEYGWTAEQMAEVPVAQRYNASLHPNAQERAIITIDDVLASKPITDPFRMLNCSLISDGGVAMIVTTAERARSLKSSPVFVNGLGSSYSYYFFTAVPNYTSYLRDLAAMSAHRALEQAGITAQDLDLAFVGDAVDFSVLVGLEALGVVPEGQSVDFAKDGNLKVGGGLPVNTHGGCLSYAHPGAPGQHLHIVEAVRQLRGEAGARQVKDARVAAVHGLAGVLTSNCTLILSNERF